MPASPAAPGAAWPGEAGACRRILLCGSWFRALHICVGRLRYGRACAVPVQACPAGGGRPGAPASPPWGRESGLNQPFFPSLCPSCASSFPPLPPPCRRVYSSPSRRTPVDAAARTPRTGYCGRRRRSDRPFRTGFIRWLVEGRVLSQAPVFHEFLESIYFFNLQSPSLDGEFDPGSGRTLAARLTHASRAVKAPSGVHKAANGRVTRGQPAPLPGIAGGNPG